LSKSVPPAPPVFPPPRGKISRLTISDSPPLRREPHQREVRRTATDIDDQHALFALNTRLVIEGRGDRFVLERHIAETDLARRCGQGVRRFSIGLRVVIDKKHRAPQHDLLEWPARSRFGALLEGAEEQAEDFLEWHGTAEHRGFAFQQLGAEQALERPHQAAFVTLQIFVQRQPAVDRTALFEIEEHHRRQGRLLAFESNQRIDVRPPPANRGVGSAEVDAAGAGR